MPGMDGIELATKFQIAQRATKIIHMSGCTDGLEAAHGPARAEPLVLAKPFTHGELLTRIGTALDTAFTGRQR